LTDQERADTRAKAQQANADDLAASTARLEADLQASLTNIPITLPDIPMPDINFGPSTYTVRSGDALEKIARANGMGPEGAAAIAAASGISVGDVIRPGQELVIPDSYNSAAAKNEYGKYLADVNAAKAQAATDQAVAQLSSIAAGNIPTSPSSAPRMLALPTAANNISQGLWAESFPNGVSRERGGTLSTGRSGSFGISNIGGVGSDSGSFTPDLTAANGETVFGTIHTHPYDKNEGGYTGISFSGGDVGYLLNKQLAVSVVQSGSDQFLLLRTAESPTQFSDSAYWDVRDSSNARQDALFNTNGGNFKSAVDQVLSENIDKYHLAYYRGQNGVFTRVGP
jgi:LysM repeat protein